MIITTSIPDPDTMGMTGMVATVTTDITTITITDIPDIMEVVILVMDKDLAITEAVILVLDKDTESMEAIAPHPTIGTPTEAIILIAEHTADLATTTVTDESSKPIFHPTGYLENQMSCLFL
jgi:hypothetical protein